MLIKNNLRVWGVWDRVISRLEYLSENQSDCRRIIQLFEKAGRHEMELLRFDLSPLYYDLDRVNVPARLPCGKGFIPEHQKQTKEK